MSGVPGVACTSGGKLSRHGASIVRGADRHDHHVVLAVVVVPTPVDPVHGTRTMTLMTDLGLGAGRGAEAGAPRDITAPAPQLGIAGRDRTADTGLDRTLGTGAVAVV